MYCELVVQPSQLVNSSIRDISPLNFSHGFILTRGLKR